MVILSCILLPGLGYSIDSPTHTFIACLMLVCSCEYSALLPKLPHSSRIVTQPISGVAASQSGEIDFSTLSNYRLCCNIRAETLPVAVSSGWRLYVEIDSAPETPIVQYMQTYDSHYSCLMLRAQKRCKLQIWPRKSLSRLCPPSLPWMHATACFLLYFLIKIREKAI